MHRGADDRAIFVTVVRHAPVFGTPSDDYTLWSTDGTSVHVTNLDWNATLAPGGGNTADIGFTGANNGAYPSPTQFMLNGTVCSATYSS